MRVLTFIVSKPMRTTLSVGRSSWFLGGPLRVDHFLQIGRLQVALRVDYFVQVGYHCLPALTGRVG